MAEAHLSAIGKAFVLTEKARDFYAFRKDWLHWAATSARNIILMTVRGSSIEPSILEGDVVMLDLGRRRIYNGSIYAVGMNETILLKKLEPLPGEKVRVISDNRDEYPPYVADAAAVRIIGQVIWYARHLLRGE